jgi:tetratricopeptide (TPR) repeat protein
MQRVAAPARDHWMATKEHLYDTAVDLFGEGRVDEAIAVYTEALSLDPEYVDALHGLAMAYLSKENYEDAIAVGKRICELTPDDALAHTSLSTFFQQQGKMADAEAHSATARQLLDLERKRKEEGGHST